jgi:hypothetical protein
MLLLPLPHRLLLLLQLLPLRLLLKLHTDRLPLLPVDSACICCIQFKPRVSGFHG